MKGSESSYMPLIKTILMTIQLVPLHKVFNYKKIIKNIIIYCISFVFLISAYVFSCIALYSYILPYWGAVLSALSLCLLGLIIGLGLLVGNKILKPRKREPSSALLSLLEKALCQIPNAQDITKTLAKLSPGALITLLGVVAIASCIMCSKEKYK